MPDNTLTLRLDGTVLLKKYRRAIDRFATLIGALTILRRARGVEWIVVDLHPGSAMMTVEGVGNIERVLDVKESYEDIGDKLSHGERLIRQYPKRVAVPAEDLSRFVGNGIESVTFETERVDAVIRVQAGDVVRIEDSVQLQLSSPGSPIVTAGGIPTPQRPPAYGAVSGQV